MSNLNYRVFYKTKFMLESLNEGSDLLWDFVCCIKRWQTKKWNTQNTVLDESLKAWSALKNGGRMFSYGESGRPVYIESAYFMPNSTQNNHFWACKISEKIVREAGYCERDWVTEIGFRQKEKGVAEFSCVISYGDTPGFIGHYEDTPSPTVPGLIKILIQNDRFKCYSGIDEIVKSAQELCVGDFPTFHDALLSKGRNIPYIYISPRRLNSETDETELLVDPNRLAYVVCGNARVFFSRDLGFTQEMSYFFDSKFCCYGGSVRVYLPNLEEKSESDSIRHRNLHPSFIDDVGKDETLMIFRRALAQNISYYESFFGITQCLEMKNEEVRKQRIEQLKESHQKEIAEVKDTKLDEAIEEEEKRLIAEQQVEELTAELDIASKKCYKLEAQVTSMSAAVAKNNGLEKALAARMEFGTYPSSATEIVNYFVSTFADRIAFTESAFKSLKKCKFPAKDLWRILFNLAAVMQPLFANNSCPDPYKEFKNCTGVEAKRGEGPSTRKDSKKMTQFCTDYNGRTIDIEPHVTFTYGNIGQSIHFGFDDVEQKIIIGHCGEHLDIYSTQKHK